MPTRAVIPPPPTRVTRPAQRPPLLHLSHLPHLSHLSHLSHPSQLSYLPQGPGPRVTRRGLLVLAAAAAASARPAVAGPRAAVHDLDWRDPARGREVPVRLHWPAAASGRLPLVLFSHGFGGDRRDGTWLGPWLAARGVACAHVQHVGSDRAVWLRGPVDWALRSWRGDLERERLERTRDLRFVLDALLAGERGPALDRRRIAAVGHSLGAQTVALLGGAQLAGHAGLRDDRIGAVALFGLAAFAGQDTAAVLRPLAVPSLHATTEEDRTVMPGYAATPDDRVGWFRRAGGPSKVMAVFARGAHAIFNDADANDPVGAAAAELVLAFLDSGWRGEDRLSGWRERHAALVSRYERRGATPAGGGPLQRT